MDTHTRNMSKTKLDSKKAHRGPGSIKKQRGYSPPKDVKVPHIKDGLNAGRWTLEENLLFLHAINVMGVTELRGLWSKIGLFVPTRSRVQVRTHAQKVFAKQKDGHDIFQPLREHRELTNYLLQQLIEAAETILKESNSTKGTGGESAGGNKP